MNAIYLCFDDAFFPFARACLNSLRRNYPGHPPLLVDYLGADEAVCAFLDARGATLVDPAPPPAFVTRLGARTVRSPVLERFKLWRSGFRGYDTILHFDADMLVLGPLDDLLERRQPFFVANHEADERVRVFDPRHRGSKTLHALLAEDGLGFPEGMDDMVNAAVFTLPRAFRGREQMAALSRLAARYGQYLAFADQSLLSLWLLHLGLRPAREFRYNYQTPFLTDPSVPTAFEDVRVLHFSSHRKPGTAAFAGWERVGPRREELLRMFEGYRDMEF